MRQKNQKSTPNAVYNLGYHFVWCTKYRRKWLTDEWASKMEQTIRDVAINHSLDIQHITIAIDHIHIFIGAIPSWSPSKIAKIIKGATSRTFLFKNPEFRKIMSGSDHLWNPSYYVGSAGSMSKDVILKYIERQKQDV